MGSSGQPKGTVTWSSFPSERVRPEGQKDPRVYLYLSGGQGSVTVPDVSVLSSQEAGKALIDAGLDPSIAVIFDQSGNAVAATPTASHETYITDNQKISNTVEEAGSVVSTGETILLKTEAGATL